MAPEDLAVPKKNDPEKKMLTPIPRSQAVVACPSFSPREGRGAKTAPKSISLGWRENWIIALRLDEVS